MFRPVRDASCSAAPRLLSADSDAAAERLAATVDLNWVLRARGERRPLASPEDALAFPYTEADRRHIKQRRWYRI